MSWDLYTYWYYETVVRALNGIVMVMGGEGYLGLLKSMALVGLITSTAVGLAKVSAAEPGKFFVFLLLGYSVMFVPKVTVSVRDVGSNAVTNVANVPLGIAFFATSTSQIGKYLTETFDTAFAPADGTLSFSRSGMGWGASAMATLGQARPIDQTIAPAMANFVRSCVVPEIIDRPGLYDEISRSDKIFETLAKPGYLNPGRIAYIQIGDGGGGNSYPCISSDDFNALAKVKAKIEAEAEAQKGPMARQLMKFIPTSAQGTDGQILAMADGHLTAASSALLGASGSVKDRLFQSITANLMNESGADLASARGDWGAVQLAAGAAIANAQSISSYQVMGMIGSEALPRIRNIVEVVLLATFPIIIIMMVVAGEKGGAVVSTYAITCLWLQLWAPLYSIVNNLLQPLTIARFKSVLSTTSNAGSGGSTSYGLSMHNMDTIIATGYSEQAMAGALVMAVPAIAYALVKGGAVAVSGAISPLSAPASGAAASAGAQAGTGNFSIGNTSWGTHASNNLSANKSDSSGALSQGRQVTTNGLVSRSADLNSGAATSDFSGLQSNMGAFKATIGAAAKQTLMRGSQTAYTQGEQAANSYVQQVGTSLENFRRTTATSGSANAVGLSGANTNSTSSSDSASRGLAKMDSVAQSLGISTASLASFMMAAQARAGWDLKDSIVGRILGGSAGVSLSATTQIGGGAEVKAASDAAKRLSEDQDVKSLLTSMKGNSVGTDGKITATAGQNNDAGSSGSMTTAQSFLEQAQTSFARSEQLSVMAQAAGETSSSVNQDTANRVEQRLAKDGHNVEQLMRAAHSSGGPEGNTARGLIMSATHAVATEMTAQPTGGMGSWQLNGQPPAVPSASGTPDAAQLESAVKTQLSSTGKVVAGGHAAVANTGAQTLNFFGTPDTQARLNVDGQSMTANSVIAEAKGAMPTVQGAIADSRVTLGRETAKNKGEHDEKLIAGPLSALPTKPKNFNPDMRPNESGFGETPSKTPEER
jgi:hypothetical protein